MTPDGRSPDFIGAAPPGWDDSILDEEAEVSGEPAPAEWREAPVAMALHGERLDRALASLVPEFSRSYLQQLVEAGAVQLGGR